MRLRSCLLSSNSDFPFVSTSCCERLGVGEEEEEEELGRLRFVASSEGGTSENGLERLKGVVEELLHLCPGRRRRRTNPAGPSLERRREENRKLVGRRQRPRLDNVEAALEDPHCGIDEIVDVAGSLEEGSVGTAAAARRQLEFCFDSGFWELSGVLGLVEPVDDHLQCRRLLDRLV